jgi:tRNA A-37 threonylcarbamoyl transferase component Bud32
VTGVDGRAGALLAERYQLQELVAAGGMGEVWRAEDVVLARAVAVKVLRPEFVDDDEFRARFRAEARHAAGLAHPGIASVFDFGETAERAWLVMELVDGEPLSARLSREGALSPDLTLDIVAQTAAALQAAHDGGVVHRDVKPGNLLLRPDGVVKVTDFGIASAGNTAPMTRVGTVVGTAYYLSPEQASGRGARPASDLYSLGVVAHECLAGGRPFQAETPLAVALAHLHDPPPALPDTVPPPVRELVTQLLAKDPDQRPGSGTEVSQRAASLRASLASGVGAAPHLLRLGLVDVPAPRPGPRPAVRPAPARLRPDRPLLSGPPRQPHRRTVRVVAVVLLALALGLGLKSLAVDSPAAGGSGPELAPVSVTSVDVSAAALVGKPAVEARDVLAGAGLVPQLVADGSGQAVGLVSGVEPAGAVPAGSTVVVHVVPEPPAEADDDDDEPRAGTDEAAGEDEPSERGKRKGRGR